MKSLVLKDVTLFIRNGASIRQDKTKRCGHPITRIETLSGGVFNYDRLGYACITDDRYSDYYLCDGDVLFSHINSEKYLGRSVVFHKVGEEQIIHGMNLLCIRFDQSKYRPKFFEYYSRTPWAIDYFRENTKRAVNQASIASSAIKCMPIPDVSLERQDAVIGILGSIETSIQSKQEALKTLDALVKSRFNEIIIGANANNLLGRFIKPYSAARCTDPAMPVLSITKEFGVILQDEKFKKRIASADTSTYKMVPRGTLIQGIHIDERNFGLQNVVDVGIVSPAYKLWLIDETAVVPEVLVYALRTDETMDYIRSKFSGSVKRRESISQSDFLHCPINLPEKMVQQRFASFMQLIDKSKFIVQQQIKDLQELLDSKMDEYFGGVEE